MGEENFQKEYARLNKAQKEAVESIYGPVMVVAGPGTGKTQIIGLRTANIILKTGTNPENILITTFTEAGVIAIKKRLVKFLGNTGYKVQVSTFHSFAQDVIKTFPEKFVEFKAMNSIDEVESLEILKKLTDKLLEEKKIEALTSDFDKYLYLRDIKDRISKLKQEGITIEKFAEIIERQERDYAEELSEIKPSLKKYETTKEKQEKHLKKLQELNIFMQEYNSYLRENSLYDFNDMINFVLEKFESDKELRQFYAETFQFIMLDEYQDTNNAQNKIIELILSEDQTSPHCPYGSDTVSITPTRRNGISAIAETLQLHFVSSSPVKGEGVDQSPSDEGETREASRGSQHTHFSELEKDFSPNILVVGDDDQSIYRFQGANIENMLDFSNKYKNTKIIVLENNYRSNQQILDLSSELIDNNEERLSKKISSINKKLIASGDLKESKNIPALFKASSELEEQSFVIHKIKELIKKGENPEEIAIIVRHNKEVEAWSEILQKNEIEVESKLKTNILNSPYVNYILNFLEIIENPYAKEEKFLNILRAEISGLHSIDILNLNRYLYQENYTKKHKTRLADILQDEKILEEISLKDRKSLSEFFNQILKFGQDLQTKNISEFFALFIEKTGMIEYVETHGDFSDLEDIYTLFNKIKEWNTNDKTLNIPKLLDKIQLYKEYNFPISRQILTEKKGGVQILTAHSSKGLEFESVFIPGLYTGNWESKRTNDRLKLPTGIAGDGIQNTKDNQLEEDRRLFFVALTRAKNNLYFSYPAGTGTKVYIESQFVGEVSSFLIETSPNPLHSKPHPNPLQFGEGVDQGNKINESKKTAITPSPMSSGTGFRTWGRLGRGFQIVNTIENSLKNSLIKYSDLEIEYIKNFLETYKLSPSDLNTFIENPLDFLHRVVFKYPFEDNKYTIFGKVYHRTLELFYLKYKNEQKIPEKSYLTSTFKLLIEKEILTPEELENALEKGIAGLEGYYEEYSKKSEVPLVLEYSFRRKNLFFEDIPITGTVDKIEKIGDLSLSMRGKTSERESGGVSSTQKGMQLAFFKDQVSLVDYKTGKVKSIGQIKGIDKFGNKKDSGEEGKYFRQLLFYRLLCEVDFEFNSKFDVGSLAIDFVEGRDGVYKLVEVEYTSEEYEDFKQEVREVWKKINDLEFWREILGK